MACTKVLGVVQRNFISIDRLMDALQNLFNPYERRAQLSPMLIALAPAFALAVMYVPGIPNISIKSASAFLLYGTISTLLATQARQAGKRREPALKVEWGGWPSMMIFRHRDNHIDPITKTNLHKAMAKSVPSTFAPTPAQEAEDPAGCDNVYLAWSEYLRKIARNQDKKYPHVFRESMSYGFHRNLYGLKFFGIALLVLGSAVTGIVAWQKWLLTQALPHPELICLGVFFSLLLFWILAVTRSSVKRAAYDYAMRLLDDCVPDFSLKKTKSKNSG